MHLLMRKKRKKITVNNKYRLPHRYFRVHPFLYLLYLFTHTHARMHILSCIGQKHACQFPLFMIIF